MYTPMKSFFQSHRTSRGSGVRIATSALPPRLEITAGLILGASAAQEQLSISFEITFRGAKAVITPAAATEG